MSSKKKNPSFFPNMSSPSDVRRLVRNRATATRKEETARRSHDNRHQEEHVAPTADESHLRRLITSSTIVDYQTAPHRSGLLNVMSRFGLRESLAQKLQLNDKQLEATARRMQRVESSAQHGVADGGEGGGRGHQKAVAKSRPLSPAQLSSAYRCIAAEPPAAPTAASQAVGALQVSLALGRRANTATSAMSPEASDTSAAILESRDAYRRDVFERPTERASPGAHRYHSDGDVVLSSGCVMPGYAARLLEATSRIASPDARSRRAEYDAIRRAELQDALRAGDAVLSRYTSREQANETGAPSSPSQNVGTPVGAKQAEGLSHVPVVATKLSTPVPQRPVSPGKYKDTTHSYSQRSLDAVDETVLRSRRDATRRDLREYATCALKDTALATSLCSAEDLVSGLVFEASSPTAAALPLCHDDALLDDSIGAKPQLSREARRRVAEAAADRLHRCDTTTLKVRRLVCATPTKRMKSPVAPSRAVIVPLTVATARCGAGTERFQVCSSYPILL